MLGFDFRAINQFTYGFSNFLSCECYDKTHRMKLAIKYSVIQLFWLKAANFT